jgi:hypothetical protein
MKPMGPKPLVFLAALLVAIDALSALLIWLGLPS